MSSRLAAALAVVGGLLEEGSGSFRGAGATAGMARVGMTETLPPKQRRGVDVDSEAEATWQRMKGSRRLLHVHHSVLSSIKKSDEIANRTTIGRADSDC